MTDREHAIVRLALSNLERSIRVMPTKTIRAWRPPLTIGEVAVLRRQLESRFTITNDHAGRRINPFTGKPL